MRNVFRKTAILIIAGILIIAIPVEVLGIFHNQRMFEKEAEAKLQYAVENSAEEMDMIFNGMDDLLNMMQATARAEFSGEAYRSDISQYERAKEKYSNILKETLEETSYISGLYLTFNPDIYKNRQEIWWAYNDKEEVEFIDSTPIEVTPVWLPDDSAYEPDYYYDAIKYGDFWVGMDFDDTLGVYMTTHTRPVYDKNNELIGIVGADIYMDNIIKMVKAMPIYEDSEAVLFGTELDVYASSINAKNPDNHFKKLVEGIRETGEEKGHFWYKSNDGKRSIAAFVTLDNGWVVASSQPAGSVMTAATETRDTLLLTMALTILAIIGLVIFLIRRNYGPIVENAEQNEIIVINKSRQAKLGEMIGNIAHQSKQPLNSINIDVSNMEDDFLAGELTAEQFSQYAEKIKGNVSRMSSTINDFADFLKPDRERVRFSVADEVDKTLSMLDESLRINRIEVNRNYCDDAFVEGFPNEFVQCIFNILENARDAVIDAENDKREIDITISKNTASVGKFIRIDIFNTGEPIPDGSRLFEPYYTTREEGGGTGLGLYLTKQIVEDHFDGKISFANSDFGVTFTIEIPEAQHGKVERA